MAICREYMPVTFRIRCSDADVERLAVALDLISTLDDEEPDALPPCLLDRGISLERFVERFEYGADAETSACSLGLRVESEAADPVVLAELIQLCCPDALPCGFTATDGWEVQVCIVICEDRILIEHAEDRVRALCDMLRDDPGSTDRDWDVIKCEDAGSAAA